MYGQKEAFGEFHGFVPGDSGGIRFFISLTFNGERSDGGLHWLAAESAHLAQNRTFLHDSLSL